MSDQKPSPLGEGIAALLDSLDPQKGDLSYRLEGMLQMVSVIMSQFTGGDRKHISAAILGACETFNQYDKKSGEPTNRYALQTLEDLSRF